MKSGYLWTSDNGWVYAVLTENGQSIIRLGGLSEPEAKEIIAKWENGTFQLLTESP